MTEPLHRLPEEVVLTLEEVRLLLDTADLAVVGSARGTSARALALAARRLLVTRLWPELGAILDQDPQEEP